MVGRLVQHEEVRPRGDEESERQPSPLPAGEHRHLLLVRLPSGEEEAAEQRLCLWARQAVSPSPPRPAPCRRSGSSTSCCEKYAGTTPCPIRIVPASASRSPSSVSSSVVFPEPFGPTSATCSPRSSTRLVSRSRSLSPADTVTPFGLQDDPPASRRLEELEPERATLLRQRRAARPRLPAAASRAARSRVSFACACFAFDFLYRNRATNRSSRSMSSLTRPDGASRRPTLAPPSRVATRATARRRRTGAGRRAPAPPSSRPRGTSGRVRRGSPPASRPASSRSSHSRLCTSRWFVGSSSSSRSGSPASARASDARVSSPPENVSSGRSSSASRNPSPRSTEAARSRQSHPPACSSRAGRLAVAPQCRGIVRAGSHRLLEAAQLFLDRGQVGGAGQRVLAQRQAAPAWRALVVERDAHVLRERELAALQRRLAHERAQQRRLAGAVRSREREPVAAAQRERDPVEEGVAGVLLAEAGCDQDRHRPEG